MVQSVLEILKDIAPEYSSLGDILLNRFIEYATSEITINFGENELDKNMAIAYLTASKLETRGGSSSVINSNTSGKEIQLGNLRVKTNGPSSSQTGKTYTYFDLYQRFVKKYTFITPFIV
jgi:hypothetical protein